MATDLETVELRFRNTIPDAHLLDKTAATLILQAVFAKDLESITQVFQRLEGGALVDSEMDEQVIRI
jgi:hypothetical protein